MPHSTPTLATYTYDTFTRNLLSKPTLVAYTRHPRPPPHTQRRWPLATHHGPSSNSATPPTTTYKQPDTQTCIDDWYSTCVHRSYLFPSSPSLPTTTLRRLSLYSPAHPLPLRVWSSVLPSPFPELSLPSLQCSVV